MAISNKVGPPVTGEDFYGRSQELANSKFSQILNMIEHDGYIMRVKGSRRKFHSPLLKKWWFTKFVE